MNSPGRPPPAPLPPAIDRALQALTNAQSALQRPLRSKSQILDAIRSVKYFAELAEKEF